MSYLIDNNILTLATLKKHLNIDADFTSDDNYILMLEEVAEELVQKHIDITFEDSVTNQGSFPIPLVHAVLLFVGNLYENRESVAFTSVNEVPKTLSYILEMYRDYTNANI